MHSDVFDSLNENIDVHGKIVKFPKNIKASNAYLYLEMIKIPKDRIWYFVIERDEENDNTHQIILVKYNLKKGIKCDVFVMTLKEYYINKDYMKEYINNIEIIGDDTHAIIRNIPDVSVDGETKLVSKIVKDLIELLK